MKINKIKLSIGIVVVAGVAAAACAGYAYRRSMAQKKVFGAYVQYFRSVYEIMDREYYQAVNPEVFERFIEDFQGKIYEKQVKDKLRIDPGVKHVGTGILVARLKNPEDPFTNFFPPSMVAKFKQSVLGYGGDIGLEGELREGGFSVTQVEPRSDAFQKGIAVGDQVRGIDGAPVAGLSPADIARLFSPPEGKEVGLEVFSGRTQQTAHVSVVSKQYFKQSVFPVPTGNPRVACLKIKFFNQETGNEMRSLVAELNRDNVANLIIDLRDNAGGPPLAAWDISGIFLDQESRLFYFKKKNQVPSGLVAPPSGVRYAGQIAILINKGTGSASELFSGLMQAYRKAGLIGQNTAGKVYLKSLFDLSDGGLLELTVAKGFLFNDNPIDFDGLKPDVPLPDDDKLLDAAVTFLDTAGHA